MTERGGVPDEEAAGRYDEVHRHPDTAAAVAFLAALCHGGRALELGVGTGRVALPLVAAGVTVDGMDASVPMLERLAARDPDGRVSRIRGDFADLALPERYDLVYCVYNAVFGLLTQDDQVRCFAAAARHLRPGGRFVVQCFVPRGDLGERVAEVREDGDGALRVSTGRHDRARQLLRTRQTYVRPDGTHAYDLAYRYAYPAELDLMARLAGLAPESRWGGWDRRPYDASSTHHVSLYTAGVSSPGDVAG